MPSDQTATEYAREVAAKMTRGKWRADPTPEGYLFNLEADDYIAEEVGNGDAQGIVLAVAVLRVLTGSDEAIAARVNPAMLIEIRSVIRAVLEMAREEVEP